jgi:hypothetical protein
MLKNRTFPFFICIYNGWRLLVKLAEDLGVPINMINDKKSDIKQWVDQIWVLEPKQKKQKTQETEEETQPVDQPSTGNPEPQEKTENGPAASAVDTDAGKQQEHAASETAEHAALVPVHQPSTGNAEPPFADLAGTVKSHTIVPTNLGRG